MKKVLLKTKKTGTALLLAALLLAVSAAALLYAPSSCAGESGYEGVYVWDMAGILTESEADTLQKKAASLAETYDCATYIVTVDDYRQYSQSSPYDAAVSIYRNMKFGIGGDQDGEMLMLSMDDRDFAIIAKGDFGNMAFTDYGKDKLDEVYLDNFRNNDWYGGFSDYLEQSEMYLRMAREGTPFDVDTDPKKKAEDRMFGMLISLVLGLGISGVSCGVMTARMKTAVEAGNANVYLVPGSAKITGKRDDFLRRTTTKRHIERSSGGKGGGGTSIGSGGFSGHSGKF